MKNFGFGSGGGGEVLEVNEGLWVSGGRIREKSVVLGPGDAADRIRATPIRSATFGARRGATTGTAAERRATVGPARMRKFPPSHTPIASRK